MPITFELQKQISLESLEQAEAAGLSNLTTGAGDIARKRLMAQSYAAMLAGTGLNYALLTNKDRVPGEKQGFF